MSLLRSFLELITSQSGALVYHLVTLFAIQLILGVAVGHWQRYRDEASTRLLAMGIGFFLARMILIVVAVFARGALLSSDVVLPPLERFLDLATLFLVVWALLPVPWQDSRLSTASLVAAVLVAAGVYAVFATLWPGVQTQGVTYNGHWHERTWEVWTTVTLVLALIASLAWRSADWGWLACLIGLWLAGHGLQLAAPVPDANSPGWVRLANLAALPLLAALVYRRALGATPTPLKEREATTLGAIGLLKAIQRIEANSNVEPALGLAASSIARAMRADMVGIGLRVEGSSGAVRMVALHPETSATLASQEPTLRVARYPLLSTALQSRRLERAVADRQVSRLSGLYRSLGFDRAGPLLVQPLTSGEEVLGFILVGNPDSRRGWPTYDEQILQALASALAYAIVSPRGQDALLNRGLERSHKEARRMAERIEELEARLDRQRERAEQLAARLRLQQ